MLVPIPGVANWDGPYLKKALPVDPGVSRTATTPRGVTENTTSFPMGGMDLPAEKVRTRTW